MNMKKNLLYALLSLVLLVTSCVDLYIPPKNIVTDDDLLTNDAGMAIYLAKLYARMPWEDFKYMAQWGFSGSSWLGTLGIEGTGEAVTRDSICTSFTSEQTTMWSIAFKMLYDVNHLIETLPKYESNFGAPAYKEYLGQAYFVRAYIFLQMARRYGGVPLVTHTIAYPAEEGASLEVPRSTEAETWDQVLADFDMAAELLPPNATLTDTANKYVALAFKAEAMLYAGSVAKYNANLAADNRTGFGRKTGVRVIGFDDNEASNYAKKYFAEAYKAAREVMKSGRYSLYMAKWKDGDAEAQYQNMVDMWRDMSSPEAMLWREYSYPTLTHGIDSYSSPFIYRMPLSAGSCPTLDFIAQYDGWDRYPNGEIRVTDGNDCDDGYYLLFDKPMDFFAGVEPRCRAYVIFPGDYFKDAFIEIRTGFWKGSTPISPLMGKGGYTWANSTTNYRNSTSTSHYGSGTSGDLVMSPKSATNQITVTMSDGTKIYASGANGPFYNDGEATLTGLYLRKYLDPDRALVDIGEGKSDQPWILMRYAEVLLAAAESAVELSMLGASCPVAGDDMLQIATDAIKDIQRRAGANVISSKITGDIAGRDIVRKERRKELALENKTKWDIRRWRVIDENNRRGFWGYEANDAYMARFSNGSSFKFRTLQPFMTKDGKWFFDEAYMQNSRKVFSYSERDYYFAIPSGEVTKSDYIDQQPNR